MTKKIDRRIAWICIFSLLMSLGAGFAYFSDYSGNKANGTAGTLAVKSDMTVNQEDLDNLNPGDSTPIEFDIQSMGNKMLTTRETIILSVEKPVYKVDEKGAVVLDKNGQPVIEKYEKANLSPDFMSEFEITDENGNKVDTRVVEGNKITYVVDKTHVLDGKKELANRESAKGEGIEIKDNIVGDDHVKTKYLLKFKDGAGNEWQAAKVNINYLVEGAQYLNNKTPNWTALDNKTIKFGDKDDYSVVNEAYKKAGKTEDKKDPETKDDLSLEVNPAKINVIEKRNKSKEVTMASVEGITVKANKSDVKITADKGFSVDNDGKVAGSVIVSDWGSTEEQRDITVTFTGNKDGEKTATKTLVVTVLRDTDGDGAPDIEDDDDDGDGILDTKDKNPKVYDEKEGPVVTYETQDVKVRLYDRDTYEGLGSVTFKVKVKKTTYPDGKIEKSFVEYLDEKTYTNNMGQSIKTTVYTESNDPDGKYSVYPSGASKDNIGNTSDRLTVQFFDSNITDENRGAMINWSNYDDKQIKELSDSYSKDIMVDRTPEIVHHTIKNILIPVRLISQDGNVPYMNSSVLQDAIQNKMDNKDIGLMAYVPADISFDTRGNDYNKILNHGVEVSLFGKDRDIVRDFDSRFTDFGAMLKSTTKLNDVKNHFVYKKTDNDGKLINPIIDYKIDKIGERLLVEFSSLINPSAKTLLQYDLKNDSVGYQGSLIDRHELGYDLMRQIERLVTEGETHVDRYSYSTDTDAHGAVLNLDNYPTLELKTIQD